MKTCLIAETYISRDSETIVKVNDDLEFAVIPQLHADNSCNYTLFIKKIKGDFEIQKISFDGGECEVVKENYIYLQKSLFIALPHTFHLLTDTEFNEVISAGYLFKIDSFKIKFLNENEFFRGKIVLTEYGNKKFEYLVKRNSGDAVEITVANPDKIRINGQNDDYTFQTTVDKNIEHKLSFIFELQNIATDSLKMESTKFDFDKAKEFIGKWVFESSGNWFEYIAGVITGVKPNIIINIVNGTCWHIEFNSMVQNVILDFELDKEFETSNDPTKAKNIFNLLENGRLHQIRKSAHPYVKDSFADYYIEDGKLIIYMEIDGVRSEYVYTRAHNEKKNWTENGHFAGMTKTDKTQDKN